MYQLVSTCSRIRMIECLEFSFVTSSCASAHQWYKNAIKFSSLNARYLHYIRKYGIAEVCEISASITFTQIQFAVCKIMMRKELCRVFYLQVHHINEHIFWRWLHMCPYLYSIFRNF